MDKRSAKLFLTLESLKQVRRIFDFSFLYLTQWILVIELNKQKINKYLNWSDQIDVVMLIIIVNWSKRVKYTWIKFEFSWRKCELLLYLTCFFLFIYFLHFLYFTTTRIRLEAYANYKKQTTKPWRIRTVFYLNTLNSN